MLKHFLAALFLLTASAEAQTFGSSTVETTPATLTASSNIFTPSCPKLGAVSNVSNILVTAASQSIALPTCPSSSVNLFVTLNICNGLSGTAPCNGTASGPFSPGIVFGGGFEFPHSALYAVNSGNKNNVSGAKDIVTCEVMGTTGPWSCGSPQYAVGGGGGGGGGGFVLRSNHTSTVAGNVSSSTIPRSSGTVGDLGIVKIAWCGQCNSGGNIQPTSVTDGTNTYAAVPGAFTSGFYNTSIWYKTNLAGTSGTITVSWGAQAESNVILTFEEWSGQAVSPEAGIGNATDVGTATAITVTTNGNVTETNELVTGIIQGCCSTAPVTGSGNTLLDQSANQGGQIALSMYKLSTAVGSTDSVSATAASQGLVGSVAGFKY